MTKLTTPNNPNPSPTIPLAQTTRTPSPLGNFVSAQPAWVPYVKAVSALEQFCAERKLNSHDTRVLCAWLASHPQTIGGDGLAYVPLAVVKDTFTNFAHYLDSEDPDDLVELRGWKPGRIVDVIEFVESKEFFGKTVKAWPSSKDNLEKIWMPTDGSKPYHVILMGSIRGGKSFSVRMSYGYIVYLFSRLYDPFAQYGLSEGAPIVLIFQSTTQDKAERVLLRPLAVSIDASPYFQANFPRDRDINSRHIYPGNIQILAMAGKDTSAFGENVYTLALTESNAMDVIKNSKKLRYSNKEEYDTAKELFTAGDERINATFDTESPFFFGKIFADSSSENPEDFAHQKVEEKKELEKKDPEQAKRLLIINKTHWEAKWGIQYFPGEPTFLVEVGDQHRASRIIQSEDEAVNEVLHVPMQLHRFFKADVESAMKRYGGKVTMPTGVFLPFREKITWAQEEYDRVTGGMTLFKHPEASILELFGNREPGEPIEWDKLINYEYIDRNILDRNAASTVRFDLSATDDATGIAFTRVLGYKLLDVSTVFNTRTGQYEQETDIHRPIFIVDGLMRFVARHGEWIDPEIVSGLIIEINRHLKVHWLTCDTAESSRAVLIACHHHKIWGSFLSVDTSLRPGLDLKTALREGRLLFPPNEVADKEMREVKRVSKNGRATLDHPKGGGTKDLFDCLQGSVFVLNAKEGGPISADTLEGRRGHGGQGGPGSRPRDTSSDRIERRGGGGSGAAGEGSGRVARRLRRVV